MEYSEANGLKFLAGGGEMGGRIRAFDWARSPLGPILNWPQSLKTSVSLILNTTHPMWIGWGPDITFLYNDAYIDVLSAAKHPQALGKPCSELWAEIWDICGPLVGKVFLHSEASFRNDVRFLMNRGDFTEETFYSFSYSPIRDESGNVGGLFCPTTDVTEKVLNTRRLQTLSELAAKSLVEKSTSGACASAAATLAKNPNDLPFALLYLIDPEGSSACLEQAVSLPAGRESVSPQTVDLAGPGDGGGLWSLPDVMRSGQPRIVCLKGMDGFPLGPAEQRVSQALVLPVIAGGRERPFAILVAGVSPARRLDAEYLTFYELVGGHIATAIQNARAAEAERKRADLLAELDRAKTTFFSNVSHEFRTPLTLMLGPLEDLLARNKQSGAGHAELEVVHRNSLRLLKLVNTLLDFSRIEAGRTRAACVETDLAALTADLASVFRSTMEKAGLEFTVDCPPLPRPVLVDRDMWEKIVFNLLSNAFKFTHSGTVTVALRAGEHEAVLSVRDTGIGISAAELPNIFKRFHRIENARGRSHEGTGIGLALANELARLQGGAMTVESAPGTGTVFHVSIPLGGPDPDARRVGTPIDPPLPASRAAAYVGELSSWLPGNVRNPISPAPPASRGAEAGGGDRAAARPRILLAEDNADMRDYVARLLSDKYDVQAVSNGVAALEAARKQPANLVLSDVMMPGLDGFGLVRELRGDPATRHIPIILVSARAGEEARVEGSDAGADDYLIKPFSARELLARVAAHLKLARFREAAAEQLRAALALREQSEARTRATLDSIADGLAVLDKDWRYVYFNEQGARIIGMRPEELLGHRVWELFPRAEGTKFHEGYHRAMATGQPVQFEEFYPEPLNLWLECRCYPSNEGLSVYFHDVTARKQAEALLRQNEALFSALVNQAPTGVYVLDAQFRLQQINALAMPAFEHVYPRIGRDFSEVMSILWGAELGGEIVKIFRHTLATGERYVSPRFSEFRQDLGEEKSYEWETQRVTLPDGQHGVVCYFNDITERTRDAETLRISEERLRLAAQTSGFGIYDCDLRRNTCVWSAELFALCGVAPDAVVSLEKFTDLCHGEDRERIAGAVAASLDPIGTGEFAGEFRIIRVDNGEIRWFYNRCQTFFAGADPERQAVRNVGVVVDITERKRSENALRDANGLLADKAAHLEALVRQRTAKLRETIEELESFSYSIAHDMRAPLRSLQGFSTILLTDHGESLDAECQRYLQLISRSANRMDRLIQDVLNYSRVVRGDYPLNPVELEPLLRGIVDTYPKLGAADAEVVLRGPFPPVLGNEAMLMQIFSNLMGNAVKFVEPGERPRIEVWAESREQRIRVFVRDNGIGIETEQHEKIFGIFQQVSKEFEGTGIGLAIVRKAAERLGGKVGLQSEPGRGSTFWVDLREANPDKGS